MRFLAWLFLFCGLVSCNEYVVDRYEYDELVSLMLDAHTLGLVYNRQDVKNDSLKMEYYKILEDRYHLSHDDFQVLMNELMENAELYEKIFDSMNKKLEGMERRGLLE
ncbi:hypothetical protein [Membranihabitans marinus]|uniref:hypothetical protein n=1 Tax=Membranihabitans marinus TaxID=1227546 RepID=UPI001F1A761A|nr:hypothetical protein [Membranihabitans marinus]